MATPRKIVKALRAGTYQPTNFGKKAREAAKQLRERQIPPSVPPPTRDTFPQVKRDVTLAKHRAYYGTPGYNPQESARAVYNSDEYEAMRRSLGLSPDQMRNLASLASKAHITQIKTGDAGELEVYLKYDFLFYHL